MSDVKDILIKLGYHLTIDNDGWRTNAMFRGGDNKTALKIFRNGNWCDFVQSNKGDLADLVKLTLGVDEIKAKEWLKTERVFEYGHTTTLPPQLKSPITFSPNILVDLIPDYSYWVDRGVSQSTAELFSGGLCLNSNSSLGKLKNRQILVIYNSQKQIIGFTGRSLQKDPQIKWKHIGEKSSWVWPAHLNQKAISACQSIILVESPADILKMWDCNIKNVICLFGTECSHAVLNFLIKKNPKRIIIATNNEVSGIGNNAAEKIHNRLKRYFSLTQLHISLPYKKDFGEMSRAEIEQWADTQKVLLCNS